MTEEKKDVKRILATNAIYYVQSCLKLVYERRLEDNKRPLNEEELEKILALRDAAREVMPLADPTPDDELWTGEIK